MLQYFIVVCCALVLALSTRAQALDRGGVCYDPYHHGKTYDNPSDQKLDIQQDLKRIRESGFSSVRTYAVLVGDIELAPLITAAGLHAAMGVPVHSGLDPHVIRDQIDRVIESAKTSHNLITTLFVGNENLVSGGSVSDLSQHLAYAQWQKQAAGLTFLKIGTVQRNTEYFHPPAGFQEIVNTLVDVAGVNIHPFFSPNTRASAGVQNLDNQWQALTGQYFGTTLALTEVGWPSAGHDGASGNTGTLAGAQTFYRDYERWAQEQEIPHHRRYFFQMFDQSYKLKQGQPTFEGHFGLLTDASVSKDILTPASSKATPVVENTNSKSKSKPASEPKPKPTSSKSTPVVGNTNSKATSTSTSKPSQSTKKTTGEKTPESYLKSNGKKKSYTFTSTTEKIQAALKLDDIEEEKAEPPRSSSHSSQEREDDEAAQQQTRAETTYLATTSRSSSSRSTYSIFAIVLGIVGIVLGSVVVLKMYQKPHLTTEAEETSESDAESSDTNDESMGQHLVQTPEDLSQHV